MFSFSCFLLDLIKIENASDPFISRCHKNAQNLHHQKCIHDLHDRYWASVKFTSRLTLLIGVHRKRQWLKVLNDVLKPLFPPLSS